MGDTQFRIRIDHRDRLDKQYASYADGPREVQASNSVLPMELLAKARPYAIKVARQINASFDGGLFDCTSVMARRLLETLIIDAYETAKEEADLKGRDGHYMMFGDMLGVILRDNKLNLGRATIAALRDFKRLGDLSAHSRRYNAVRSDIENVKNGIRVAVDELLHLSSQA